MLKHFDQCSSIELARGPNISLTISSSFSALATAIQPRYFRKKNGLFIAKNKEEYGRTVVWDGILLTDIGSRNMHANQNPLAIRALTSSK